MTNNNMIGPWIRRFLMEHVVAERNLAHNTQLSYRDTLAVLLPFVAEKRGKAIDRLTAEDITPELARSFLLHLEQQRHCSIATRNQRLAAIHALARFVGDRSPEYVAWCAEIRGIPFKKGPHATIPYLEKHEMDALMEAPNRKTTQGFRDYAVLLFLYNTGARADEAANVKIEDLQLGRSSFARLNGKGNKVRLCPLWPMTGNTLNQLIVGRQNSEKVFLNRCKQPLTRYGIYALVERYAAEVGKQLPSLLSKQVSPHTIRHTTAVHLLRSGVDINTIRAWLGHVSLDTTNVYAEVDLEMKAKALAGCEIKGSGEEKRLWHEGGIMAFLRTM